MEKLSLLVLALLIGYTACLAETSDYGIGSAASIAERLEQLESHIRNQDDKIVALERQVSTQTQQLRATNILLNKHGEANSRVALCGQAGHQRGRRATALQVAFSAYLDHRVDHVVVNSIIRFNSLILNDGGAYSNLTGIFTVPVTGVYLFTYTVNTYVDSTQLVVKLVLDGDNMSDGISDPFHNFQEIQGGNTVIFRANKQQSIWLAAYNTGDVTVDGRDTHRFSTFSGYLLYQ